MSANPTCIPDSTSGSQQVEIEVANDFISVSAGLKRGHELMSLAKIAAPNQLVLEVRGDVDIALASADAIIIRGGEKFSIGDGSPQLPDNPTLRNPIAAKVNGQLIHDLGGGRRGKATFAELVSWGGGGSQDLWIDIDDLADEQLVATDRIVLQAGDNFLTVQRETEDASYEVVVLLDGEDQVHSFPANITVLEAIRRSLAPRDRDQAAEFVMVDATTGAASLDPNATLKAAGVRDGHTLSITKKNGGGG
ncbi:MAG: hypothetical protein V4843_17380 [Pseudomonadota bacterium]